MSKRQELTLTKSASNVWFSMDGKTIKRLKECGIEHPIPDEQIKESVKALVAAGHRVTLQDPIPDDRPRRKRREKRIRDLALAIATDLFTAGNSEQADRLVLTRKDGRDLGGWGLKPMADRIEMILLAGKFPPFSVVGQFG